MILEKKVKNIYIFLIFLGLSFAIFGNGIKGDFVYDDGPAILGNPLITHPEIKNIPKLFLSPYYYNQPEFSLYRPLTTTSYFLNWLSAGESTISFHVVNIILHALVAFSLFLLLKLLFKTTDNAFLAGIIFLFIPIHVEAVTSIIGRAELLSSLFTILALYFYNKKNIWLSLVAFLLALLSKETAVTFIGLWLFIEIFIQKQKISLLIKKCSYFILILAVYFILRYIALKEYILSSDYVTFYHNPIKEINFLSGIYTSLKVTFLYIQKTIFPTVFSSDYSYNQIKIVDNIFTSPEAIIGLLLLSSLVFIAYRKRGSVLGLAAVFFLFPYFIISNFVLKIGTIMGERLIYMPSVGIAMFLAIGIKYLFRHSRLKIMGQLAIIMLIIFYSTKTITRNRDWLTKKTLYESAFINAPESVSNMSNEAYILAVHDKDLETAKILIDKTIEIAPKHVETLTIGGVIYNQSGNQIKAEELWKKSILINPKYIEASGHLGRLYFSNNRLREAEEILTKAVAYYPRQDEVYLLSLTKSRLKKYNDAISIIKEHFGENPEDINLKFALGFAYYKKEDINKARFYFDQYRNPDISYEDFIKSIENL